MNQNHLNMLSQINNLFRNKILLKVFFEITIYYLAVYIIGVLTYYKLTSLKVVIETIAPKDNILNSLYIFVMVLIFTLFLIFIIRFLKRFKVLKIIELFFLFISLELFFSLFIGDLFSLILTILLLFLKEFFKIPFITNIITTLVIGFVSGYMAYALGILPIIVLLILLGIYDYISVFKTKHMVYLANNIINENTSFVYTLGSNLFKKEKRITNKVRKTKEILSKKKNLSNVHLGTGDFALPLIAVIFFTFANFWLGFITMLLLILILYYTFYYLYNNRNKVPALPALPLQSILLTIVYVIYIFLL